jgi:hypothetical protein
MVNLKTLGKIVKSVKLTIVSIEDESTTNSQVLRVELAEDVPATGSMPLSDGSFPKKTSNVIYVGQGNEDEKGSITAFMEGLKKNDDGEVEYDADGFAHYEGPMKLDISKPRIRNGKVVKEPRVWLTTVRFANGAQTLINENRTSTDNAILKLFGRPVAEAAAKPEQERVTVSAGADDLGD